MSSLERLRKIINQQTSSIGSTIRNLIGPVPEGVRGVRVNQDSTWLLCAIPGSALVSLEQFYSSFSGVSDRGSIELKAVNGVVTWPGTNPGVFLLRGLVQVVGTINLPIEVSVEGGPAEFACYVDGSMQRRGTGRRSFSITLDAGNHLLEFVVASSSFAVTLPSNVRVIAAKDVLDPPVWHSVIPYYMDPSTGTAANILNWFNDRRVGGWIVLRRELTDMGAILAVSEASSQGVYTIAIAGTDDNTTGNWVLQIPVGATMFAGFEDMGVAQEASHDSLSTYVKSDSTIGTGITIVSLKLPAGRSSINQLWVGRSASTGVFQEIARIQRASQGTVVTYKDGAVAVGEQYEYVLQAYGLLDNNALSPYSDVRYVRAGDTEPPGPIDMEPLYPQVINNKITARYRTPTDPDYAGVRVLYKANQDSLGTVFSGTVTSATSTSITDTTKTWDFTASHVGLVILITGGTGAGQVREITTLNSADQVSIDSADPWFITPDATSTYEVYDTVEVITDFGVPNTLDQVTFDRVAYGTYTFLTFDKAGNIQDQEDGVVFEYDPTDDGFLGSNLPPVVGIRQLRPDEQATYPAPYNQSNNYAIVELTARDPVDELEGVQIQYRRRNSYMALAGGPNSPSTVNAVGTPWVVDEWKNYLCEVKSGTAEGEFRLIANNTTNQLILAEDWTSPLIPDTTSTIEIAWVANLDADNTNTTLDDHKGTRSRYIAVSKTDTTNWIQVRAVDQDGLYTEPVSYSPDFDSIPEISGLDTRLDTVNDLIYVTGAVDDDTQSFEWWLEGADNGEPTVTVPNHDFSDTSVNKAFPIENTGTGNDIPFNFTLADGQKKTLVLRPWSGIDFTGVAGPDFKRELTRSPRTVVVFDNRDERGTTSAVIVRASFYCTPEIDVVDDGNVTALNMTGTPTLTTDGSWSAHQFQLDESLYQNYFVRVYKTTVEDSGFEVTVEQFSRILDNTSNVLTLETAFDMTTIPPDSTWDYEIRNGCTFWKKSASATGGAFSGTLLPQYIVRDPLNPIYLQYYSVLNGVPAEPVHTAVIDADDLPSITGVRADEVDAFVLRVAIEGPDDDTKSWIGLCRKGAWPTRGDIEFGATQTECAITDLDTAFTKFNGPLTLAQEFQFDAGPGTWYVAACPVNGVGQIGTCKLASEEVDGTVEAIGLTTFEAAMFDEDRGSDGLGVHDAEAYNLLYWSHTPLVASPQTQYTLTIYVWRADQGESTRTTLVSGRKVWADAVSGQPPVGLYSQDRSLDGEESGTTGTKLYSTFGSYLHHFTAKRSRADSGGRQRSWSYRALLMDGSTEIANYGPITVTGYFKPTVPVFDDDNPPTVVITNSGACSTVPNNKGIYTASPGITQRVQWHLMPGTENTEDYYFVLYRATVFDPQPGDFLFNSQPWTPPGTDDPSWTVQHFDEVETSSGYAPLLDEHTVHWTWRIDLVRDFDDVIIATRYTNTVTAQVGRCNPDGSSQL